VPVAYRFHLVKNLGDAVEGVLQRHRAVLQRTAPSSTVDAADRPPMSSEAAAPALDRVDPACSHYAEVARLERRTRRLERYTEVVALREQGLDLATIARRVGVSRRTVTRFLAAGIFPERKRRTSGPGQLDPYIPYLLERWDAGCHNATQLWRELCTQGYVYSHALVHSYVARLRKGERPVRTSQAPAALPAPPVVSCYTPREAKWLFLRHPAALEPIEQQDLAALQERGGELAMTYTLTQGFTEMVRTRTGEALESWLTTAHASAVPELRSLANGIVQDKAAVLAGLTMPWSQGQVEGHVNRLKLIKRQMFGRAKIDLLRQRVVHRI
jgi:transposase